MSEDLSAYTREQRLRLHPETRWQGAQGPVSVTRTWSLPDLVLSPSMRTPCVAGDIYVNTQEGPQAQLYACITGTWKLLK